MTEGADGDLFERIAADDTLGVSASELQEMARPEKLVGGRRSRWTTSWTRTWRRSSTATGTPRRRPPRCGCDLSPTPLSRQGSRCLRGAGGSAPARGQRPRERLRRGHGGAGAREGPRPDADHRLVAGHAPRRRPPPRDFAAARRDRGGRARAGRVRVRVGGPLDPRAPHAAAPRRVRRAGAYALRFGPRKEYRESGTLAGEPLPTGLAESDPLRPAIFSPATKATEGHDEKSPSSRWRGSWARTVAAELRRRSLDIYETGRARPPRSCGIILADTKFEFGIAPDGRLLLIDEC